MSDGVCRITGKHLFENLYFKPEANFVLRSRTDKSPVAAGLLILDPAYADPKQVDSQMPCFRLGAYGTEGMQTKRVNGLFSFVARADNNLTPLGLDLMGHAAYRLRGTEDIGTLASTPRSAVTMSRRPPEKAAWLAISSNP